MYTYGDFDEAVDMVNRITTFSGPGHSRGIHTADPEKALELGSAVKVSRVDGQSAPVPRELRHRGGDSVSENVTCKHLRNTAWIFRLIPSVEPSPRNSPARRYSTSSEINVPSFFGG